MKRAPVVFLLATLGLSLGTAATQEPMRGPDAGAGHSRVPGVQVLPVTDAPFSAKTTTEWTRTQEDGSTVALHLDAFLARDSRGLVYRENHHFVPAGSKDVAPLYELHLLDPVTRTQLYCLGRTYECVLRDYKPATFFETTPEGSYDQGARTLTREQLGTDAIEGIPVIGTRETWTIGAGRAGNEKPLVSSREFWYSEKLQTNLAVTRIDPLVGKQIIRLSHISLSEPNEHLWVFQSASGFVIYVLPLSAEDEAKAWRDSARPRAEQWTAPTRRYARSQRRLQAVDPGLENTDKLERQLLFRATAKNQSAC